MRKCCLLDNECLSLAGRLCSGGFYVLTEQMCSTFAACFILRGHEMQIDFLWSVLVGMICPLKRKLLHLRLTFGLLFFFLQSASWIWMSKSNFLLSVNVKVSCNVLSCWAHLNLCLPPMWLTKLFVACAIKHLMPRVGKAKWVNWARGKKIVLNSVKTFDCDMLCIQMLTY